MQGTSRSQEHPPHPTAGASGTGPPVAPENWRWRCGQRLRDMYFYAPNGRLFRSKVELTAFLGTFPDGPSPDDFCWRVTPEILNSGFWNKDEELPRKASKPRLYNGSHKRKQVPPLEEAFSTWPPQMASKPGTEGEVHIPHVVPLAMRAPCTEMPKKVRPPPARSKVKARKKKSISDATEGHPSFKEVLAENSSFMWLRHEDAIEAFILEANGLEELTAEDVSEMRSLLVARNLQLTNLVKYPNDILRIFARILGVDGLGREPPASLGKVELATLCVNLSRSPQSPGLSPHANGQTWR